MVELNPVVEDSLVIQAKQGDRNAFSELVGRCYENVIRVVYHLCGDAQIAQDATQEAFIRAWVRLPSFQPRAPFRNWVYRIAINTALDTLRQKPVESIENSEGMLTLAEKSPGPEAAYIEKEQVDFLQGAVKALPEAARTVLVLREYGELTYAEIATVLEIPVGTVMSRLNYARNRLREMLRKYRYETEGENA
ncbi:MAG TPA: sigma-70 family RNA polymerase sigma factor [Anaerolineaceae bacterium]|nr:sigma-70 family RNA polymerase sigma factor [Anaerolineaceae bacterium]